MEEHENEPSLAQYRSMSGGNFLEWILSLPPTREAGRHQRSQTSDVRPVLCALSSTSASEKRRCPRRFLLDRPQTTPTAAKSMQDLCWQTVTVLLVHILRATDKKRDNIAGLESALAANGQRSIGVPGWHAGRLVPVPVLASRRMCLGPVSGGQTGRMVAATSNAVILVVVLEMVIQCHTERRALSVVFRNVQTARPEVLISPDQLRQEAHP